MKTLLNLAQCQDLVQRYSEPHRKYHKLEHIAIIFQLATAHGIKLSIPQQLAIWYHDAIYCVTTSLENEIRSAELMKQAIKPNCNCWLSDQIVERASNIIIATKWHRSEDNETQVVLDLDLAMLGFDWDDYAFATDQIRQEYGERFNDDREWAKQRLIFVQRMLNRNKIYYTSWARDCYEEKAQQNLLKERDEISKNLMRFVK
jgi:predicted metal-dependent HD superfamily phosphohydrolase